MKAYSIFDDFPVQAVRRLEEVGVAVTVHPMGVPRPDECRMEEILVEYDCVIIGTTQKITEQMLESVTSPKIIATASAGTDHIHIPPKKQEYVTLIHTPGANAISVAEYVVGAILLARKRFFEGSSLYERGLDNKKLLRKPEELCGSTVGLVGAGRISTRIMELLQPFCVRILCYTKNPASHRDLTERFGVQFVTLRVLATQSDILAVNVPETASTRDLISAEVIAEMKDSCVFVSISRESVVDINALLQKAESRESFYAILDLDVSEKYTGYCNGRNIILTPHIAGGSKEARNRMFLELAEKIALNIEQKQERLSL